jgi:hypothetical protein
MGIVALFEAWQPFVSVMNSVRTTLPEVPAV